MEESKTTTGTAAESGHGGCLLCNLALPLLEQCLSDSTRDHFRNSRVEFLKGIRGLLDDRIAHLSKTQQRSGTHVVVE